MMARATPAAPDKPAAFWSRRMLWTIWLVVALVVGVLLAANAHLVYVAFTSQPDCIQHVKGDGAPGTYRAARSAC